MIAISHDTQTPKLGSSFCSKYPGMKQRSNLSLLYPAFSYLYVLPSHYYPLAAATVPQPKVQLFLSPCLGVHSPSNLQVWPPSHKFQMVYSSFVYCANLKALVAGWPLGWPPWEETRACLVPDTAPGGSTTHPSLGKAEPIRHGCGNVSKASVEMYLWKSRNPGQGEEEGTQKKWLERKKEQRDEER